jgi:hypothetical protein
MNNFEISFSFQHHRYQAEVSIIRGVDHIQYTISTTDRHLLNEYGAQVIHEFAGKPLQIALPGSTAEQQVYAEAVAVGLQHFLHSTKSP